MMEIIEEIENYFLTLDIDEMSSDLIVDVTYNEKNNNAECIIHIKKMYHGLGNLVSFVTLSWLSEKLKTKDINLQNEYYASGGDTCDYGSSHSVDIICKLKKINENPATSRFSNLEID